MVNLTDIDNQIVDELTQAIILIKHARSLISEDTHKDVNRSSKLWNIDYELNDVIEDYPKNMSNDEYYAIYGLPRSRIVSS